MPVASRQSRRRQEGRAPAEPGREQRAHAGGERDAEIAADAVEGERAPARLRGFDQHGHADRVVDGGEHAEREQRDCQHGQIGREGGAGQRNAAADIEQRHHVAPAPAVGEPAGRQREHAEGDESGARQRDQLAIGPPVDDLEPDHHRRVDQQHEMVDAMRPIEEGDGAPRGGVGTIAVGGVGRGHSRVRPSSISDSAAQIYSGGWPLAERAERFAPQGWHAPQHT